MSEVTPIRPGLEVGGPDLAVRDKLAETAANFAERWGHPPTGGAWVLFDDEGNGTAGYVTTDAQPTRQFVAYAGARLTAEALDP